MNPGTIRRIVLPLIPTDAPLRIDASFLDNSTPENCYRLETYRSTGSISATASQQLRCYFITKCHFPAPPPPSSCTDGRTDIRSVSDPVFLEKASENTLEIYQGIMWQVENRYGPVMEVFEVEGTRERRLVIGYKMGGTSRFFRYAVTLTDVSDIDPDPFTVLFPIFTITTSSTRLANMSSSSPTASRSYASILTLCLIQLLLRSRARSSK